MFHVAFISYRPTWNLRRHCNVFVQNVTKSFVFSDVLKSLHCIANLTTVLFTWEFGTVMKSQNGLFDQREIRPVVSFISPVSCKRYEAYDQRPICDKSHDGRRETSCKRPLSTAYYTDIGYLIYKLLYDANIFFGFIITYPVSSEVNIIRYGTNISDAIYFEILEISCNYPIL